MAFHSEVGTLRTMVVTNHLFDCEDVILRRMRMTQATFVLALLLGVTACSPRTYTLLDLAPIPLASPQGFYRDIAWLEPNVLALLQSPTLEMDESEVRLRVYDFVSDESYLLPDETPSECLDTWYGRINRLPNGLLGYLVECLPHQGISIDFRLHEWNQTTQTDRELFRYPIPFEATAFSFAPDMNTWLQEETGDGLFNKLYYVEMEGQPVQLLAHNFARVGMPSWLPDGRILFAGTPQMPEQRTNLFSGLPGIQAGLGQLWSIYLTDMEALRADTVGEEQVMVSEIKYMEALVGSPDGEAVAFLGTIDGHEGLWVYRMATGKLARVWAGFGPYAWSPDGDKIAVLVREPGADLFMGQPAIIELRNVP